MSRKRNSEEGIACMAAGLVMEREKERRGDGRIWESRVEVGQGCI